MFSVQIIYLHDNLLTYVEMIINIIFSMTSIFIFLFFLFHYSLQLETIKKDEIQLRKTATINCVNTTKQIL